MVIGRSYSKYFFENISQTWQVENKNIKVSLIHKTKIRKLTKLDKFNQNQFIYSVPQKKVCQMNMLEGSGIFSLKSGIHSSVWSTKTFLYNITTQRYKQGDQISRICKTLDCSEDKVFEC